MALCIYIYIYSIHRPASGGRRELWSFMGMSTYLDYTHISYHIISYRIVCTSDGYTLAGTTAVLCALRSSPNLRRGSSMEIGGSNLRCALRCIYIYSSRDRLSTRVCAVGD